MYQYWIANTHSTLASAKQCPSSINWNIVYLTVSLGLQLYIMFYMSVFKYSTNPFSSRLNNQHKTNSFGLKQLYWSAGVLVFPQANFSPNLSSSSSGTCWFNMLSQSQTQFLRLTSALKRHMENLGHVNVWRRCQSSG